MEANVAIPAALIGDPVRAAMLLALLDDRSMPATALAWAAGVSAQAASNHLAKLIAGGLLQVTAQGRHRYYRLAGPDVAHALEALAVLGPPPPMLERQLSAKARRLRAARSCYDHLAGQLGVALADALEQRGLITESGPERYMLSEAGCHCLAQLGVAPASLGAGLKGHARPCLDWTERRRHLAGIVPARLFTRLLELGWIRRGAESRAIFVTPSGHRGLKQSFGLVLQTDVAA
jgi:DNA-binding transcriptional ArsR family regulator